MSLSVENIFVGGKKLPWSRSILLVDTFPSAKILNRCTARLKLFTVFVLISGLFEGDIVIDEDTKRYLLGADIMSRDAVISPIYYWPNGVVYYKFDKDLGWLKKRIYVSFWREL